MDNINTLPDLPGVYIMKDKYGEIIYIGKAVNLKRRVSSYFRSVKSMPDKTVRMVSRIDSFEIIITDTELEALILECRLIKKNKPYFNAIMKNDSRYPYIRVTSEKYPRIIYTTVLCGDGSLYFGPYRGQTDIEQTIELVRKLWKLRRCDSDLKKAPNQSHCLNYSIGQCLGPCFGKISAEDYSKGIIEAVAFLNGNYESILNRLNDTMVYEASELRFEKAAAVRNNIQLLNGFIKKQKTITDSMEEKDMLILADSHVKNDVLLFYVRSGRLKDKASVSLNIINDDTALHVSEKVCEFICANFDETPHKMENPLQNEIDEIIIIRSWLSHARDNKKYIEINRKSGLEKALEISLKESHDFIKGLDIHTEE